MDKEETKSSDATLVERAINGNKEAFDRLMQKHVPICYQLARRFGLSAEDASDLVQDAFFAAYRSLHRFNFSYSFSTWITRILVNRISNFRRGVRRAQKIFWRPADANATETVFEKVSQDDPHTSTEHSEFHTTLEKALNKLPKNQRMVFILFEIEGLKTREIASIMDIPEGTVTSRLHHARLSLRKRLEHILN